MPSIEESLKNTLNLTGYTPVASLPDVPTSMGGTNTSNRNPFVRCPVPPIGPISVDNLDQFSMNGLIPQYRIFRGN